MIDLDNLLGQFLKNIELDNNHLSEYFKAYRSIVDKFGYEPAIQPGQIQLLGWDLEYRCGAAFANFIDQILVRRLNDFTPENDHPLILDCGANIGFSSLSYKRQFPNARIVAFEPDPEIVPILRHNLERNSAGDVEVVDSAIWVENGISQWYCEGIDGSHLGTETGAMAKTTTVQTVDLRDFLNEPIDLIKMDIEGAEYDVINHVSEKLNHVKAMSIECHLDQKKIVPFGKMLGILSKAGFQVSVNSFGVWRDLIHWSPVLADHHENYILVSAWRGSTPSVPTRASWVPGIGAAPMIDYTNHIRYILEQTSAREAELLNYLDAYVTPRSKTTLKRSVLEKPYRHEIGLSWAAQLEELKSIADEGAHPNRSTLLLYEDDKLFPPVHSLHDDIRNVGGGLYSHWDGELYFSTSDGSDPNTNGRVYQIVYSI